MLTNSVGKIVKWQFLVRTRIGRDEISLQAPRIPYKYSESEAKTHKVILPLRLS